MVSSLLEPGALREARPVLRGVTYSNVSRLPDPTVKQHMLLCQCAGTARFAYNYGLARKQEVYKESSKFISAIDLQKELTARKHTDLPWLNK